MITAEEANYKTKLAIMNGVRIPKEIEESIDWCTNRGYYSYYYDGTLDRSVVELIRSLGYKVEYWTILGRSKTKISW